MNLSILNTNYRSLAIVDVFKSLIWVERYYKYGDFELYIEKQSSFAKYLLKKRYLTFDQSDRAMIIQKIDKTLDSEGGKHLLIKGKSLESILCDKIVWNPTVIKGGFQAGIKQIIAENIINPTDADRKVSNFIFEDSDDPYILALTLDVTCYGETLYDLISYWCEINSVGFKITLTETNQLKFKLYYGKDRSYDQILLPYVILSESNHGLKTSTYVDTDENEKTISLIVGPDDGTNPVKILSVQSSDIPKTGLDRKEIFVDASSVSQTVDGVKMTDADHYAQLAQKGFEVLAENSVMTAFDAELDPDNVQYIYKEDYDMGDICQFENEDGDESKVRVIEFIISSGEDNKQYPTFEIVY